MNEERDAFLAAIRDDPFDVTTRKVFADWLDEHDEPEEADRFRAMTGAAIRGAYEFLSGAAKSLAGGRDGSDDEDDYYEGRGVALTTEGLIERMREAKEPQSRGGDVQTTIHLSFDTPDVFSDAAKLWAAYALVTGDAPPKEKEYKDHRTGGTYKYLPTFVRCAC